jgi:glycosyltransferase involved in cell wall biosynthesis
MGSESPAASSPASDGTTVYIDAGPFSYSRLAGLSRYTARLALALAARGPVRFFCEGQELLVPENLDWSQDQDLARWSRRVWRSRRVPLGTPPSASLGLYCSVRPPGRTFPFEVSVLHDFSPLVVPGTHLEPTRAIFQEFFARALPASDLAVADSHSTKADATWLAPMDPERVIVAYPGPSLCVNRHGHPLRVRRRPGVGLVVSTIEPRKNPFFLLDWFHTTDALSDDAELWWVGPLGWLTSRRELRRRARARTGRSVRFLGVVSDARLCELYQTAGWSIYPSLYEGFGFPVLDALRHGTPVLVSFNSALREFEGPGIHFFDPCDPASVDRAWCELRAAGPVEIPRAPLERRYCWENVACTLLEAHARSRTRGDRPSTQAA